MKSMKKILYGIFAVILSVCLGTGVLTPQKAEAASFTFNVTGNDPTGYNAQRVVDRNPLACINYSGWGFSEVAGHNYGIAGNFTKFRVGTTVKITGHCAGTYQVTNIVSVPKAHVSVSSIPKGFAFQTCVGSRMNLYYAKRIDKPAAPKSYNPKGHVDSISTTSDGKITVKGWAFDADTKRSSIQVHVYIDGKGYNTGNAAGVRNDVQKAYRLGTNKLGLNWTSPVLSDGNHKVEVYAINKGGGKNVKILTKTVKTSNVHNPLGRVDKSSFSSSTGKLSLKGWAFDPDTPSASTSVHVYVDGKMQEAVAASNVRSDVQKAYSNKLKTKNVGFDWTSKNSYSIGNHKVQVYSINRGTGSHKLIMNTTMKLSGNNPQGRVDKLSVSNGKVNITGWVFDTDARKESTQVHVYIDGRGYSIDASNVRNDVLKAYKTKLSTNKVGYNWTSPTLSVGKHTVKVYAINKGAGSNTLISNKTITVNGNDPTGRVDKAYASAADGEIHIIGWAFDADTKNASIPVNVYIDGKLVSSEKTNSIRVDVQKAYKNKVSTNKVGFDLNYAVSNGTHRVQVYAMNTNAGKDKLLYDSKITMQGNDPIVSMESIKVDNTGLSFTVNGWAVDKDDQNKQVMITVLVDNKKISETQTSMVRDDIKKSLNLTTNKVGFSVPIQGISAGSHKITVLVKNVGAGKDITSASKTVVLKEVAKQRTEVISKVSNNSTENSVGTNKSTVNESEKVKSQDLAPQSGEKKSKDSTTTNEIVGENDQIMSGEQEEIAQSGN